VTGKVTRVWLDRNIHSGFARPWVIRYNVNTVEGQLIYGQARTWDKEFARKHPVNGPIVVMYRPDKPRDNRPAGISDRMIPWFIYLIFGAELLGGIIFYFVYSGIVSKGRALYTEGIATAGIITSLGQARYINVGRKHPYNISYLFKDPNSGREHEGFMRSYSFDLAKKLKKGDEVTVLYDWENPTRNMIVL
jgi:hypothetical protein